MKKGFTLNLSFMAMFAALIACGAFIAVPLPLSPVPIVLQNAFAVLSGMVLGPFYGAGAVAIFLAAGTIGAPVFAGGSGGIAHFFGPTGGFLLGYLAASPIAGLLAGRAKNTPATLKTRIRLFAAAAAGFIIVYVPGIIQLHAIIGGTWKAALLAGCLPFLVGDFVKAVIVVIAAERLRKVIVRVCES
ncbi:MAG: biotin transporter BioY [Termitinemataceae bacterium]|nr:MAG: biotin transporter BioY [Termitinemataceae bacterium]